MSKPHVKLVRSEEIAEGTRAFYLEKPSGFEHKAGQTLDLTLLNPPSTDAEGNTRAFTIASAPHEPHLMVATRLRDTAFKRVIRDLAPQSEVEIDGPFGSFTLHNDVSRPAVFLIGGIGVTPVRSIVVDATKRKLAHKLYLFYSNRRPEDAAFLDELKRQGSDNPNFKLIATMTEADKSRTKWDGERGFIDRAMLSRHLSDFSRPVYYLAGPRPMVAAMRTLLSGVEVNDDNIRTEEFSGY